MAAAASDLANIGSTISVAQAAAFHAQFVQTLNGGAASYAATEAASASPLQSVEQDLLGLINAPTQAIFGRPLIGKGGNGAPG